MGYKCLHAVVGHVYCVNLAVYMIKFRIWSIKYTVLFDTMKITRMPTLAHFNQALLDLWG